MPKRFFLISANRPNNHLPMVKRSTENARKKHRTDLEEGTPHTSGPRGGGEKDQGTMAEERWGQF